MRVKYINIQKALICLLLVYVNFIQYKIFSSSLFLFGTASLLVCFVGLSWQYYKNKIYIPLSAKLLVIFAVYMLLFPTPFSTNINYTLETWLRCFEYTIIMLCIIITIQIEKQYEWLIKSKAIFSFVTCLAFLIQPYNYHFKINTIQYSLTTTLNPNTFGLDILFGLWCSLWLITKKKFLFFNYLAMIIFLYSILLTASRKTLLGALICLFLWFVWIFYKEKSNSMNSRYFKWISYIFILVGSIYFFTRFLDSTMFVRLSTLFADSDTSVAKRLSMYREGFLLFLSSPIFGSGYSAYENMFGGYSHATLVEIPISGGIVGTVLYFSVFVLNFKSIYVLIKSSKNNSIMAPIVKNIKLVCILWIIMSFLCTCIIHPYLFNSYIIFALCFSILDINRRKIVYVLHKYKDVRKYAFLPNKETN